MGFDAGSSDAGLVGTTTSGGTELIEMPVRTPGSEAVGGGAVVVVGGATVVVDGAVVGMVEVGTVGTATDGLVVGAVDTGAVEDAGVLDGAVAPAPQPAARRTSAAMTTTGHAILGPCRRCTRPPAATTAS
jgi:hypothetical protein